MDTDAALTVLRNMWSQLDAHIVSLEVIDADCQLSDTWSALNVMTDALNADIARLESD